MEDELEASIRRWSEASARSMQAPGKVVGLRTVDGRLIADIEGAPSIDITDWFASEPPASGAN